MNKQWYDKKASEITGAMDDLRRLHGWEKYERTWSQFSSPIDSWYRVDGKIVTLWVRTGRIGPELAVTLPYPKGKPFTFKYEAENQ